MRYSELLAALLGLIIRDRVATGCADSGDKTKDPRGCWNVRCQLGKRCCRKKVPNAKVSEGENER